MKLETKFDLGQTVHVIRRSREEEWAVNDQAKAIHAAVAKELGREPTIDEIRALVSYFDCSLSLDGDEQCEACRKRIHLETDVYGFGPEDSVYLCETCMDKES